MLIRRAFQFAVLALALHAGIAAGKAATLDSTAVVFAYGRIGEDQVPNNSIRVDQFEAHLEELSDDAYHVLPLTEIVDLLKEGKALPERAVALTFDDASRSFYETAWPRLRAAGLPFTLFVATDPIDRGSPEHMTWHELRQLAGASNVTIGGLGASTASLAFRAASEAQTELDRMESRLGAELGRKPRLFAYPQGEYTLALRAKLGDRGYLAAFGLQSGVLHAGADRLALPRFIMTETFGGIERFRIAASALPLPVGDVTPAEPVVTVNPPPIGFTVDGDVGDLARLACFSSSQGRTGLERVSDDRVEIRLSGPLPPGRSRINCTLPANEGRWRWFGLQFVVPR